MMPISSCRLCGATKELQESHILPGFVFRWKKETSATGYLRFGQQPNLRVQDGVKLHLLCRDCERRFNKDLGRKALDGTSEHWPRITSGGCNGV